MEKMLGLVMSSSGLGSAKTSSGISESSVLTGGVGTPCCDPIEMPKILFATFFSGASGTSQLTWDADKNKWTGTANFCGSEVPLEFWCGLIAVPGGEGYAFQMTAVCNGQLMKMDYAGGSISCDPVLIYNGTLFQNSECCSGQLIGVEVSE